MPLHLQSRAAVYRVAVAMIAVGLAAAPARGQELDASWFKQNYLPAAEKLAKAYGTCSAKVSRVVTNDKSDLLLKTTISFAFDGSSRKFDRTVETAEGGNTSKWTRSTVASPEVSFTVRKDDHQVLERVNRSPLGWTHASAIIEPEAIDSIYAPFALLEHTIAQWITTKGFEIKSVKRAGDKVRLEFNYQGNDRQYAGSIAFLPDRQWVIDQWDITLRINRPSEYSLRIVCQLAYGKDDPVPHLSTATFVTTHADRTDHEKLVVNELTFAPAAQSEFKLSSYGYDDRIGMPGGAYRSFWFWLALAGIACVLGSLAVRWVIAKRAIA